MKSVTEKNQIKNNTVVTLINKLYANAVIEKCSGKYVFAQ